jgi:hypothetical protein
MRHAPPQLSGIGYRASARGSKFKGSTFQPAPLELEPSFIVHRSSFIVHRFIVSSFHR